MRIVSTALVFGFLLVSSAYAQEQCCSDKMTRLDISAQSDIKAAPDIATVSAGVLTVAKTANQAMKDNATRMTNVFDSLKKAGIDDKDIQTSGMSLNPQYNYVQNLPPTIVNYQANNNVTVRIKDMKNIGTVLDALVAQGANQLNGPNFSVDNPDTLMDTARKEAVKKATDRAKLYADAVGLKIKRIITISEQGGYAPQPPMMMKAMRMDMAAGGAAESTPVATGEVGISVTVNIAFELE